MTTPGTSIPAIAAAASPATWHGDVLAALRRGGRFAGLLGTDVGDGCRVTALVAVDREVRGFALVVPTGPDGGPGAYPSLTVDAPAASWYERALHDLFGVRPNDHPYLEPLLLTVPEGSAHPRPGSGDAPEGVVLQESVGLSTVAGHGIFSLPFGPVRSGVNESVEFLIETPGEDIPHITIRPHYKHRGMAKQFEGRTADDGLLVAERVEGVSSVAHALAFAHAIEGLDAQPVPEAARLIRTVHAELERIVNHLDVTMRLCDAAGLAVATARFGWHKEIVMRLVSHMTGSRFGRGVVAVGGVHDHLRRPAAEVADELVTTHRRIRADVAALESSASFLDRLRGTGPLSQRLAAAHGALGPVGRASGLLDDVRWSRPYDAYDGLVPDRPVSLDAGDAMARARVRWAEIDTSVAIVTTALAQLGTRPLGASDLRRRVEVGDGFALGWAEAAQGEVLYALETSGGLVRRCFARSPSFHNLPLFGEVFRGDIFTDFPFIEASLGLSYAGVAM